ncbi:MAG: sigma-70 family RNA polymerase sigma factor [Armatimonadetes bacterium]|nr:sigma-70 family RNA polymerase sigma factor [Armatimonadota bacterium]
MSTSTNTIPDTELLALQLRQRDRRAFGVIYDRYSGALYGVIVRIVQVEEMAEDVLQETFIKIWKNAESYDNSRGTLFTWMLNIARNSALDKLRSSDHRQHRTNRSIENLVGEIDRQQSSSYNPEVIGLREFVLKLKPDQQQLIDLIYYQGFTQSEAADQLGIPLGTVKTRVRSALIRLRELMNAN